MLLAYNIGDPYKGLFLLSRGEYVGDTLCRYHLISFIFYIVSVLFAFLVYIIALCKGNL